MGLRSALREHCGHTMSFPPFMPIATDDAEVFLAARDGALSYVYIILLRIAQFFLCAMEESGHIFLRRSFSHLQGSWNCHPVLWRWFWPKNDSTASLMMLQPCWNMVAIHQPSTAPQIWTFKSCKAFIREPDCLKISRYVFLGRLQPLLFVSIVQGWLNIRFTQKCSPLEDPTPFFFCKTPEAPAASNTCFLMAF